MYSENGGDAYQNADVLPRSDPKRENGWLGRCANRRLSNSRVKRNPKAVQAALNPRAD
ncbi:MAG TPA: hypothetical protein VFE22_15875 [Edaphobacter sp.]|nr:hypothetical protein [Edaphobacter sp.]